MPPLTPLLTPTIFDDDYYEFLDDIAREEDRAPPKQHGAHYLGTFKRGYRNRRIITILDVSITARTFFAHDFEDIENYLFYYNPRQPAQQQRKIEIMKLDIAQDGTYHVVLKTFWLRIIQRIWRRVYRAARWRGTIFAQRHFELCGRSAAAAPPMPLYLSAGGANLEIKVKA